MPTEHFSINLLSVDLISVFENLKTGKWVTEAKQDGDHTPNVA